jgi:RNA polymerase sigma-70 factor (ECF subfamily)
MFIFSVPLSQENYSKLEALYKEHISSMYKVARSILNDEYLAQDAVQEAFINIFNNLEKISQTDCNKMRALFVIIVRNVSIDIYRLRKKEISVSLDNIDDIKEDIHESAPNLDEILIDKETFTKVAEIIKNLHPTYADILSLKLFYQYNDEEISRMLNISPENMRTRLHRARKGLIKLLSQEKEGKKNE